MARVPKCRRVCMEPVCRCFLPAAPGQLAAPGPGCAGATGTAEESRPAGSSYPAGESRPAGAPQGRVMSVEELESLRLCDLEGFGQDEAARRMEVSRQTLQRMLYSARAKTAQALTQGVALVIGGGNYSVSTGGCGEKRPCSGCMKWKSEESDHE